MRVEGPNPRLGLAVVRVVVGVTFVAHGAPKLFEGGVSDLAVLLADLGVPLPEAAAWLVSLVEFGGGLALLVGLLVTPVALLLAAHMAAGVVLLHAPAGWHVVGPLAEHPPGGVELNVVLLAALLALVLAGPGTAAIDARRRSSGLRTMAPEDRGEAGASGRTGGHDGGEAMGSDGSDRREGSAPAGGG